MRRTSPRSFLWAWVTLSVTGGVLLLSGCGPVSVSASEKPEVLQSGRPLLGQFSADPAQSHHAYSLFLEAGQCLRLSISQPEIDVSALLWSPRRQALLRTDSPPGADERLFLVAPETGEYQLVVSSEERGTAGAYSISVKTSRRPSEKDRLRAQAAHLASDGEVCLKAGGYECARLRFEEALARWRRLGDSQAESQTLYKLGFVRSLLEGHQEAYAFWEQKVLPLWLKTRREPLLLNQMGEEALSDSETEPRTALSFHQRALDSKYARWHSEDFRALLGLIEVYRSSGEVQQGLNTFRTALGLARSERERSELFGVVGALFLDMGDLERALQSYARALEQPGDWTEPRLRVLSSQGFTQCRIGDYGSGLKTLEQALPLSRRFPASGLQRHTLNHQGTCYVERYERTQHNPEFLKKAKRSFEDARGLAKRAGDEISEGIATSYLGRVLDLQGNASEAIDFYTRAYELFPEGFPIGRAGALNGRARALRRLRRRPEALSDIKRAIQFLEEIRGEARSTRLRASFISQRRRFYELEIALLAGLHGQEPEGGYAARAFERSEAFRARSLLDELVTRRQPKRKAEQGEGVHRLDEIEARLQQLHPLLQLSLDEAINYKPEEIEEEVRDLLVEWEILRARSGGTIAGSTDPKLLDIRQIGEQLLGDDTLIVAYMLGEDESFVWVIGREIIELHPLGEGRAIEDQARLVANLLAESHAKEAREELNLAMTELSTKLLAPIAEHLGRHRLVILRDGGLYRLPFDALPDPRRPTAALMDSNEVVYEPSAAVFAAILERSRQRPLAERTLAAFGDAVFQSEGSQRNGGEDGTRQSGDLSRLERLPASGEEVRRITGLLPEGEALSLLRFDARRDRFLDPELARYRIIHIATHSRLDEVFPELSSLVFSMIDEWGKPQNGLLTFYEISDLRLPVDMVVLSSCRTALGKEIKGEGVIGLGRAFLHAGASRVVVSLWDVNDEATAALMQRFYEGMFRRQLPPSEALREARILVRSQPQWQAPYYWASFILEGDWH